MQAKQRPTFQLGIKLSQKINAEDCSDEFLGKVIGHSQRIAQENQQMRIKRACRGSVSV